MKVKKAVSGGGPVASVAATKTFSNLVFLPYTLGGIAW